MQKPSSKKANAYFQAESQELQSVFAKVKVLEELNRQVATYLDVNIVNYCQVANLIGNKLILIVANGSIATQLRFMSVDLLRKFKQNSALKNIQSIECKVRPSSQPNFSKSQPVKNMPPISNATAEIIREIAESFEDAKLREVMMRIAGRTKA